MHAFYNAYCEVIWLHVQYISICVHVGSESPTVPTMDQTPPPTAVDGTREFAPMITLRVNALTAVKESCFLLMTKM